MVCSTAMGTKTSTILTCRFWKRDMQACICGRLSRNNFATGVCFLLAWNYKIPSFVFFLKSGRKDPRFCYQDTLCIFVFQDKKMKVPGKTLSIKKE
jgi:hypothetical protein